LNVRGKVAACAATFGLVAGVPLVSAAAVDAGEPPPEPVTVTMTCAGANPDTQGVLDLLGGLQTPPVPPPVTLQVSSAVTSDVPETAGEGETVPVSFSAQLLLPESLIEAAQGFGITSIPVADLNLSIEPTGGGTGGPFPASPTDFTIGLSPPSVPVITASGDVTITDETQPTLFAVVNPVTFTATVTVFGQDLPLALRCEVPEGTYVAAINGELPPPPSTTTTTTAAPTTTTTAAPAAAATQRPRFTG